jgi:predicted adenylyl cyclase CyaB
MPRNIEIKARINSIEDLLLKAASVADSGPIEILQDDTFFCCQHGRLKLRTFSKDEGELIFYRRPDQNGPKESFYLRSRTNSPEALRQVLATALGQIGRVRKHRTLYLAGRTRIHLDRVESLGDFLELEVLLADGEDSETGRSEAHSLMARLGVEASQLVDRAYVDLIKAGV